MAIGFAYPLSALFWDGIEHVLHVQLHGPDAADMGIHLQVMGMLSTIFPPDLTPATTVTI